MCDIQGLIIFKNLHIVFVPCTFLVFSFPFLHRFHIIFTLLPHCFCILFVSISALLLRFRIICAIFPQCFPLCTDFISFLYHFCKFLHHFHISFAPFLYCFCNCFHICTFCICIYTFTSFSHLHPRFLRTYVCTYVCT